MTKDIIIEISGAQNYEDQEPDSVALVTTGKFKEVENGAIITYEESIMEGMAPTLSTVDIDGDVITVSRTGQTRSHMVFQLGQKHLSYYDTPYGSLTVGVSTKRIEKRISETDGEILIEYAMEINSALVGENSLCMKFRNAGIR